MSSNTIPAEKILARLKGLRNQLQTGEVPLFTIPAIWDGGQEQRSMPCDVALTSQRLIGYAFVSFPRERLFLEALPLSQIKAISLRHKTYEPLFRELLISAGQRRVYIRAPRQKIESLYESLRSAIEQYAPLARSAFEDEQVENPPQQGTIYGRQEIRAPFERSSLAITLLFTGGLMLEISGVVLWEITHSAPTGLPLFVAGFIAVLTAILVRRQKR